jgi:opacity protein-like surface antigen
MNDKMLSKSPVERLTSARWAGLGALAVAAGVALWSEDAGASNTLGIALDYTNGIDQPDTDPGGGLEVYFGPRMDLAILSLTTELSGGFHNLGGDYDPSIYRLVAGGKLGVGVIIRPSVFAHIGVGHLRYDVPITGERDGRTNLTADAGLALDFTLIPLLDLGIHGSYNVLAGDDDSDAFEWLQAGVHATFVFGG